MKTRKLLSLFIIGGTIALASCSKDDSPSPLTKEEAKTEFASANSSYNTVRGEYESSQGQQIENYLDEIDLPISMPGKKIMNPDSFNKEILKAVKPDYVKGDDYIFDFASYVGTWTYNSSTGLWDHATNTADKVIFIFTYTNNSVSKNVTLTFYDYKTTLINSVKFPAGLKGKMEMDGQIIWTFSYSASRSSETSYKISYEKTHGKYVISSENSFSAKSTSTTSGQITSASSFVIKKDGSIIYSATSSAEISVSGQISTVVVTAKIRVLTIELRVNVSYNNTNENPVDPNTILKMAIYTSDGAKIGDVKLVKNTDTGEWDSYIYYTDGTSEPAKNVISNILEEFEGFVKDLY